MSSSDTTIARPQIHAEARDAGSDVARRSAAAGREEIQHPYMEAVQFIGRIHSLYVQAIKLYLDGKGMRDINGVQALMLHGIGDTSMKVGELTARGCYLGSNVTYNVKKMTENGYVNQERSIHDRREINVRLTEKGLALHKELDEYLQEQDRKLGMLGALPEDIRRDITTLQRLGRFMMRTSDRLQSPRMSG